jgi:hypothetical protein
VVEFDVTIPTVQMSGQSFGSLLDEMASENHEQQMQTSVAHHVGVTRALAINSVVLGRCPIPLDGPLLDGPKTIGRFVKDADSMPHCMTREMYRDQCLRCVTRNDQ